MKPKSSWSAAFRAAFPHALPEAIALAVVVILHLFFRKMLISIAAGTVCYMVLVQFVF